MDDRDLETKVHRFRIWHNLKKDLERVWNRLRGHDTEFLEVREQVQGHEKRLDEHDKKLDELAK